MLCNPSAYIAPSELGRGLAGALGMRAKVEVDLNGVNASDAILFEIVLLSPRIEQKARIARSDGASVVANHEVLVLQPTDHSAGVSLVHVGRERDLTLSQEEYVENVQYITTALCQNDCRLS